MKLLLLLSLVALALGNEAFVSQKVADTNELPQQAAPDPAAPVQETVDDKRLKRSYGWPSGYGGGYIYGWPWYGFGGYGHGWYGWPIWYGGYGHGYGYRGWPGGWYKGW